MALREIQDVEESVTGKRPDHSTIIHSVNGMKGMVDDYLPDVLTALADSLKEEQMKFLLTGLR